MAKKKMKAYVPRWVLWIVLPMLVVVWSVITYLTFATAQGRQDPGVAAWLAVTVIVALVAVMLWLMASGRLPAYIIEIEDDDGPAER